jgi:hypothetical protein
VADHVPGRTCALPQRGGDRPAGQRAKLHDLKFRAWLQNDDGLIEERERGVRERPRADGVALPHDISGPDRRIRAVASADIDTALEDRDVRARLHSARGRPEDHSRSRREQQERRKDRGDDEKWAA